MECAEACEHLYDLNRGWLEGDAAATVPAHVAQCAACREALQTEARIHALIRAQATRLTAPPELGARIRGLMAQSSPPRRSAWLDWIRVHPWMAGGLVSAMAAVLLIWAGTRWSATDPLSRLVARAVDEHAEYAGEVKTRPAPDPADLLNALRPQVDFAFEPVFRGDSQVQLVTAVVADLDEKRAAAFVYRDVSGQYTTLFLMPEAGTVIPAEGRLPIETFKPHHRLASGRHLLLWKQRDLACLLVSDADEAELPAIFLRIRKAG